MPTDDTAPADDDWHRLTTAVDAKLGRYQLRDVLGTGGMGVVFEAIDPELDRAVAVKILRSRADTLDGGGAARLRREGVTMARLTHPNVIRVYDVGVAQGHVFVAMELVRGGTLAEWVSRGERTAEEIIAAYVQAGRGLAAAHDAGLVHRDFKPQNVLVGDDGRVLVTDFGLARPISAAEPTSPGVALGSPTEVVTRAGEIVGTPAFMAPEQHGGGPVDARADQFSFCLSLWRALGGAPPRLDTASTAPGGTERALDLPSPNKVPSRIRAALQRGLELDPERRFPSMRELLAQLEPPRPRTWPAWLAAGLAALAIAALVAWIAVDRRDAATADPCAAPVDRFGAIWNRAAQAAVRDAFTATGLSYAEASFRELARQLDARGRAWELARRDSCEDTRRRQQSDALMDLRAACLERRLDDVAAFVVELRRADAATVNGAAAAAATIGDVTACGDGEALARRAALPADATTRETIGQIERELSTARASVAAGRMKDGLTAAEALIERARATGYAPVLASALAVAGEAHDQLEQGEPARAAYEDAALAAEAGGDDQLRFECEAALVRIYGYKLERDADATVHARRAEALLQRLGPDPRRTASLERSRVHADWWAGRYQPALERVQAVIGIYEELDPGGVDIAKALHLKAILQSDTGDVTGAVATEVRAQELAEPALGANHPVVGTILLTKGGALRRLDRFDEARDTLERALAIVEEGHGPESQRAALVIQELATVYLDQRELEQAITMLRRGLAIMEKTMGPDHSRTALMVERLGSALSKAGHAEEAEQAIRRAIAIHTERLGPDSPAAAESVSQLGEHFARTGRHAKARAAFVETVRALEASQGAGTPQAARDLIHLGDAELALGHRAAAAAAYRRALAVTDNDELRTQAETKLGAITSP